MTIYERERDGHPVNPALALYKFWHSTLTGLVPVHRNGDGRLVGRVYLSKDGGWAGSISFTNEGPKDRPTISGPGIHLTHRGEFKIFPHHGYEQRRRTARNTFLGWNQWRGYNWFVDTNFDAKPWSWETGGAISDWRQPQYYVSEEVVGAKRPYWDTRPFLKLEWADDFGWHIVFSRSTPSLYPHTPGPISKVDFDKFEALRQQRYALMEQREKLASGELLREGRRIITAQERLDRRAEQVQVIMANLSVTQSARTTPLRRERKEEGLWPQPLGCP